MRTTTSFFFIVSVLLLNLSACKSDASSSKELQKTYFYPVNGTPYIYVFQDSLDPFFEMFERIVNYNDPLGKHVLIERYNANFNLVESYDLLADKNFQVFNHILYSGSSQIIAQISDSTFMPWSGTGTFVSSFPGAVDSLYFSLKNKRSLNQEIGVFEWNGTSLSTRIFTDSIFSMAVDIKNKREKAVSAVAFHEFAEGLGRVRIRTADGKSNLVLKQILTEEDWKSLVTK